MHDELLSRLNAHCMHWGTEPQRVFDDWWSALGHDLRSPRGEAFRALRGLVAGKGGCELLSVRETLKQQNLIKWLSGLHTNDEHELIAHRLWVFALAAAPFDVESTGDLAYRALAQEQLDRIKSPRPPAAETTH
ncbi:MAG: hypothetical protein JNK82_03825 [Myxococcaceae bacterium]|nr:hypothetical protein [Myxococcaceae bacterium]